MRRRLIQKADETHNGFFRAGFLLICWLAAAGAAGALPEGESADPSSIVPPDTLQNSELFLAAQTAYDDGLYADATALYRQLISNGVDNVELHYNLANASFKNGSLPDAVLYYRRAWYKAPRDPDIQTNLRFALNAAGAAEPIPSPAERIFYLTSLNGWMAAGAVSYVVLTLLLLCSMLIRRRRRSLLRLSLVPAAVLLLAAGGWRQWHQFDSRPEWVVVKTGATALFGPIEGATAHYKVPLAALVRQNDIDPKGWVEIEYDGKTAWLKEDYITRVSP
jgi:tetratricopeptide (TPR) repeat protein